MTITTYEVTLSGHALGNRLTVQTVRAKSEDQVKAMFDDRKIIAITPIKTIRTGGTYLKNKGIIA